MGLFGGEGDLEEGGGAEGFERGCAAGEEKEGAFFELAAAGAFQEAVDDGEDGKALGIGIGDGGGGC